VGGGVAWRWGTGDACLFFEGTLERQRRDGGGACLVGSLPTQISSCGLRVDVSV